MILRCVLASLVSLALCAQEPPLTLKAARLLDVRTGKVTSPAQLWIKDGRIQPGVPPAARRRSIWVTARCCPPEFMAIVEEANPAAWVSAPTPTVMRAPSRPSSSRQTCFAWQASSERSNRAIRRT